LKIIPQHREIIVFVLSSSSIVTEWTEGYATSLGA